MRVSAVLPLILLAISTPALAADPQMPELLQGLEKQGVIFRYLGGDQGLDGWVGFKNGQEQYFYATPDRQAVITGILLNNKGDQVTLRQIDALRKKDPAADTLADAPATPAPETPQAQADPAPAATDAKAGPSKAEQLFAETEASSWVALGQKTAPVVYSFIDPQCPHCHEMIQDVRKSGYLEKGLLQLRLVPVGLMNAQSLSQAANLVAAPNAPALLFRHLDGDKTALLSDKDPNTQTIQRNMILMQNWKLDVTPFSIYKTKSGEIKILRGRPEDLKSLVAELK